MKTIFIKHFRYTLFILLLSSTFHLSQAQNTPEENSFFEKMRYGGSLGLSISNGFFNASIAPQAIYDFNAYTSAGIGILGSYTSANNYKAYNYGGSVIGFLRPIRVLELSAEFEELHVSRTYERLGGNLEESYWYPSLFLGIGYISGPVRIGVRYDVLYDSNKSIYGNALMPFVSIYF